jgi:hypothetical protein
MWTNKALKKASFLILTSVPLLANVGCSSQTSSLSESGYREEIQFVIMGGNSTCKNDDFGNTRSPIGTDIYNAFQGMLAEVNANNQYAAKWIVSCHRNGIATVYYTTSESMNQVVAATQEEYIKMLTGQYFSSAPRAVFLAGHSYGGWLAMKTTLAASPEQNFGGIFTIDPISRVHCTFTNPGGCMSAPRDISNPERSVINDRSGFWGNYYQTKTFYLHSAPMEEADENLKLNATHTSIDNDPIVWSKISTTVQAQLSRL